VGPLSSFIGKMFAPKQKGPASGSADAMSVRAVMKDQGIEEEDNKVAIGTEAEEGKDSFKVEPLVRKIEAAGTKLTSASNAPHCMKFIVSEVMTRKLISLQPSDTLEKAADMFLKHSVSGAPVIEKGYFVGEMSKTDLLRMIKKESLEEMTYNDHDMLRSKRVAEAMKKPVCIYSDMPIDQAVVKMDESKVHRLLVTDKDNKLVGIVTKSDLEKVKSKERIGATVFTKIDDLLHLLEEGPIELTKLAKALDTPEPLVEDWAKILEEHYLVEITYPPIGSPIVRLRTAGENPGEAPPVV
jgi:acetoin utilization protein AcuB